MQRTVQVHVLLIFLLSSLVLTASATAQVVIDPTHVEFVPSTDHNATGTNGQPVVQQYEFQLYAADTGNLLKIVPLGKPAPGTAGTVRLALSTVLSPLPTGGVSYVARVASVGPGGSVASAPSNAFSFPLACSYTVSPASRSMTNAGGASSFSVTAPVGCAWTATRSETWITITSGASGSGNGTVAFTVATNTAGTARSATLTIAGQSRGVTQAAAPCTFGVSPASQSVARAGGPVTFSVTAPSGCAWSATEQATWLSIASGASGAGNGSVTFSVAANTTAQSRSATATVAGRSVTLTQPVAAAPTAPTGFRVVR